MNASHCLAERLQNRYTLVFARLFPNAGMYYGTEQETPESQRSFEAKPTEKGQFCQENDQL